MTKTIRIIRQELISTLQSKMYVFITFGIPVLVVIILAGFQMIKKENPGNEEVSTGMPAQFQPQVEGYVDQSGLIQVIPSNIPKNHLVAYPTEALAQQALDSEEINAYYVIPPDYMENGEIYYVYPDTRPLIEDGQDWIMRWTITVNLLGGDEAAADWVWNPVWYMESTSIRAQTQPGTGSGQDCSRPGFTCQSNLLIRYLPVIMVALFYGSFMASSNMLFNSIGKERENRMIEVLLLSIHPRQLLAGKTIALACAGLFQMITWLGAIYLAFTIGGQTLDVPDNFSFPVDILAWSLVLFLGGYALYASLMAGTGALVPKMKEAGAANIIAMLPLFAGYLIGLIAPLARATDDILPVTLSMFPLTAPIVMVMRLVDGIVPLWQLVVAVVLTYVTAYFSLHITASMFHAQNLLSGQPFSIGRYIRSVSAIIIHARN